MPVTETTDGPPNSRDDWEYFKSFKEEMHALKNRVRHFIREKHWHQDGVWKESVLRSILRRHLPLTVGVGTGFIVSKKQEVSTQNDILLYDRTRPILFQDGDFVIVTPDVVLGLIEVKTKVKNSAPNFQCELTKLAENVERVLTMPPTDSENKPLKPPDRFFGYFSYESEFTGWQKVLTVLNAAVGGKKGRIINCISLGPSVFVRFWKEHPTLTNPSYNTWHSYNFEQDDSKTHDLAPAYFIHNVIEHLCPASVLSNNPVWYPAPGKESFCTGTIALEKEVDPTLAA